MGEGDWKMERLNPLSAGRSFQTDEMGRDITIVEVLIPYQQGGLFRRFKVCDVHGFVLS